MKQLALCCLVFLMLAASSFAQNFEGQLVYERINRSKAGEAQPGQRIEYFFKGNAVRIDFYGDMVATTPRNSYIADKNGRLLAWAMDVNGPVTDETRLQQIPATMWDKANIVYTGARKTIQGQNCRELEMRINQLVIKSWVADLPVDYNQLLAPIHSAYEGLLPENSRGLPLEVVVTNQGREVFSMRALRVSNKPVDAGRFRF